MRWDIGVLTFGWANIIISQFHAIERLQYVKGRTNTAEALLYIRTEMFTALNGDRQDVPNFAVVITDGESNINEERTLPEAIEAR